MNTIIICLHVPHVCHAHLSFYSVGLETLILVAWPMDDNNIFFFCSINKKGHLGDTVLHIAAKLNKTDFIEVLVDNGAGESMAIAQQKNTMHYGASLSQLELHKAHVPRANINVK